MLPTQHQRATMPNKNNSNKNTTSKSKHTKVQRTKIQVQFHLAQRNYKRIAKRISKSFSSIQTLPHNKPAASSPIQNTQQLQLQSQVGQTQHIFARSYANFLQTLKQIKVSGFTQEMRANIMERSMSMLFAICAALCAIAVLAICFFLFGNAIPTIAHIGFVDFIFGMTWRPSSEEFGIFPMIIGSLLVSGLAIAFGVGIGILSAIYLARFCGKRMRTLLTPCVELLAGIPSIVYGFFGLVVLVPFIGDTFETSGKGLLTASILLGLMILPTIILISKTSIEAAPQAYYEGAIALGASKERAVFFVLLRDAKSGILASVILGMGRAIGEAMAVIIVAGNQAMIPESITDGFRTLTTNIVLELGYAQDLHREVLIACGVVLFVFILLLNLCFSVLTRKV